MKRTNPRPQPGDLRVWNIINPPREPEIYPVKDVDHAMRLIDAMADSQLLQPKIESNVFGLEVYQQGEWEEWENDEGEGINEVRRSEILPNPTAP